MWPPQAPARRRSEVTPSLQPRRLQQYPARPRGFTMVEMLVALVVLAVGMLGVAILFGISLHSGSSAISRMQAVNLAARSEEHTSELQSQSNLVCRLLLEKKKK